MAAEPERTVRIRQFWPWFRRDGGWRNLLGSWRSNLVYLGVGVFLAFAADKRLSDLAPVAMLPFVSAIIGSAYALSASASSLAQTETLNEAVDHLDDDMLAFQASFLGVMVASVLGGLAALGVFDSVVRWIGWLHLSAAANWWLRVGGRSLFFAVVVGAFRECWGIVNMTTTMTVSFVVLRRAHLVREQQKRRPEQPTHAQENDHSQAGRVRVEDTSPETSSPRGAEPDERGVGVPTQRKAY